MQCEQSHPGMLLPRAGGEHTWAGLPLILPHIRAAQVWFIPTHRAEVTLHALAAPWRDCFLQSPNSVPSWRGVPFRSQQNLPDLPVCSWLPSEKSFVTTLTKWPPSDKAQVSWSLQHWHPERKVLFCTTATANNYTEKEGQSTLISSPKQLN